MSDKIEENKQALIASAERVVELLRMDAPDTIAAHAFSITFKRACAIWPEKMSKTLIEEFVSATRMGSGLCQTCDNAIRPRDSYKPTCVECDERIRNSARELGKELTAWEAEE